MTNFHWDAIVGQVNIVNRTSANIEKRQQIQPSTVGGAPVERGDYSDYVVHFTKDKKPHGNDYNADDPIVKKLTAFKGAKEKLASILNSDPRCIFAAPLPYVSTSNNPIKCACFTECTWHSLLSHASRYSGFGVGFKKETVFAAGGGPVHYLRQDVFDRQFAFEKPAPTEQTTRRWGFCPELYQFVRPFHPEYAPKNMNCNWVKKKNGTNDHSREREWCVPGDFRFTLDQVAFVILPSFEDLDTLNPDVKSTIGQKRILLADVFTAIDDLWPIEEEQPPAKANRKPTKDFDPDK